MALVEAQGGERRDQVEKDQSVIEERNWPGSGTRGEASDEVGPDTPRLVPGGARAFNNVCFVGDGMMMMIRSGSRPK